MSEVLTLESPEISLTDFRALRENREVKAPPSEAPPAVVPAVDAETAGGPETPETNLEAGSEPIVKPAPKRGMVDEIAKLRIQNRELTARLEQPKPILPAAEVAKPAAAAASDDVEPDVEKFTDYPTWLKAWNRWDRRQETKTAAIETAKTERQATEQSKAAAWNKQVETAKTKFPDFETVALNKDLPVTPVMASALTDSELGTEILHHLGSNPDEAMRISKLSPAAQMREIGKIEMLLTPAAGATDDESETPPLKTIPISKAPAPVSRPSGGTLGKPNPIKLIDSMTQAEYRAYREAKKL
jgi:hypothetical protein